MKKRLDALYGRLNRREYVYPDPLATIYRFEDIADREIAALVASSLAYGRVQQIIRSLETVFGVISSPAAYVLGSTREAITHDFAGFKHRWTTGREMASLLWGLGEIIRQYGSLESCFMDGVKPEDTDLTGALTAFVGKVRYNMDCEDGRLLPCPSRGSACKRLHLFLRWMVREDDVDPGGWRNIPRTMLMVPLDVHMHRICRGLGMTKRNQADLRTTVEVTSAFRKISPDDPVRYDFSLTRLGIRDDMSFEDFFLWDEANH
ncbi:MAG TPA: TIGR02757 family protein [Proteobacteria bacterium]|nr:hypothetical protein BMS3Abin14_00766 [bacterium BMS3Abin14]HDL54090.1 TIGR02757 family protein [Pseudomonadota bacterium]